MSHLHDDMQDISRTGRSSGLPKDEAEKATATIAQQAVLAATRLDAASFVAEAAMMGRTRLALVEVSLTRTAPHAAPDLKRLTDAYTAAGVRSILQVVR